MGKTVDMSALAAKNEKTFLLPELNNIKNSIVIFKLLIVLR